MDEFCSCGRRRDLDQLQHERAWLLVPTDSTLGKGKRTPENYECGQWAVRWTFRRKYGPSEVLNHSRKWLRAIYHAFKILLYESPNYSFHELVMWCSLLGGRLSEKPACDKILVSLPELMTRGQMKSLFV